MTVKTLSNRLTTLQEQAGQRSVDRLVDALIDELGHDEARRFWDLWHTSERSAEENDFIKQVLARPAITPLARGFCGVSYAYAISEPIGVYREQNV